MNASILSISDCISKEEIRRRGLAIFINLAVWLLLTLFVLSSYGLILVVYFAIVVFNKLLSEFDVRKLRAIGVTISDDQMANVYSLLTEVCSQFQVEKIPTLIVVNQSETNAFAVRYADKHVIVLCSQLLESSMANSGEIKFILGHELAHLVLSRTFRNRFELFKLPSYRAAREMTCDSAGVAASGDIVASIEALRKLTVGHTLSRFIDTAALQTEAQQLYSGATGWLLKKYLSYPPIGKRIEHAVEFAQQHRGNN
jgi:Zn-dependent protease with chaperone function